MTGTTIGVATFIKQIVADNTALLLFWSVTIFAPRAGILPAFLRTVAGKTLLISLSRLDKPDKFTLGCLADLNIVLPGDFPDFSDFHK